MVVWMLLGAAQAGDGTLVSVLGWTADGTTIAWTEETYDEISTGEDPEAEGGSTKMTFAQVLDVATGQETRYVLEAAVTGEASLRVDRSWKDASAFGAWKAEHPLTVTSSSRRSADGTVLLDAVASEDNGFGACDTPGAWAGDVWTLPMGGCAQVSMNVVVDGHTYLSAAGRTAEQMITTDYRVQPSWSPDGTRVAWFYVGVWRQWMRGPIPGSTTVTVRPVGPRIEVLAPKSLDAGRRAAVVDALLPVGPVLVGTALKERDRSVVYAPTSRRDGAAIAAAVPFGATVEPLTWKANGDVVVAVGSATR